MRWTIPVVLAVFAGAVDVEAQAVAGTVTDVLGSSPLPGVLVILQDSAGRDVTRAITNAGGGYRLTARVAGAYSVRALRIGSRPSFSPLVRLRAGDTMDMPALAVGTALVLDTVRVLGRSECPQDAARAASVFAAWDQARGALGMAAIGASGERYSISLLAYRRTLDPWRDRVIEQETTPLSRRVHEPWVAPSADELHTKGYVLSETEGWLTYRAPGLDALSSDEFVQDHCFRMVAHDSTRSLVGVAFEPTRARRDLGEIRGIAWLDRATSELRRIEFWYVNIPVPHEEADAGGVLRLARLGDSTFFISE